MTYTKIYHENNFETNVTSSVSAGATTTPLDDIPSVSAPFYLIFDPLNANNHYEEVLVTSKTATNINHAALTSAHGTGETVRMAVAASDLNAMSEELASPTSGAGLDGWIAVTDTWTYSSYDSNFKEGVITVPSGAASLYSVGMKIKINQPTDGEKKAFITKVEDTALTIYLGTDYDLDNEAITSPYYSFSKEPLGFPTDPDKWTIELTDTTQREQASPSASTWYNPGSLSINIPTGSWDVYYAVEGAEQFTGTLLRFATTLSTANNSQSDSEFTDYYRTSRASASNYDIKTMSRKKALTLSAKDTYYINIQTEDTGADFVRFENATAPLIIRAVCTYL